MEEKIKQGEKIPDFKAFATGGNLLQFSESKGKKLVLFFYPKDNTPGCTKEGEDFRDKYGEFKNLGVEIFGVSRDSMDSHEKFKSQFRFPFELIK